MTDPMLRYRRRREVFRFARLVPTHCAGPAASVTGHQFIGYLPQEPGDQPPAICTAVVDAPRSPVFRTV